MQRATKDRVRAEYDAWASDYERRWWRYTRRSVDETLKRATIAPGESVLDVGCGTGLLLSELRKRSPTVDAIGVDLSIGMLAAARHRGIATVAGDAERLPFQSRSFDVVVSSSSFHFWPDRSRALSDIHRLLKPGGRIVITDWCDDFLACRLCDLYLRVSDRAHQPILSRHECAGLLEASGFVTVSIESYRISWLWGLMTVTAGVERDR